MGLIEVIWFKSWPLEKKIPTAPPSIPDVNKAYHGQRNLSYTRVIYAKQFFLILPTFYIADTEIHSHFPSWQLQWIFFKKLNLVSIMLLIISF